MLTAAILILAVLCARFWKIVLLSLGAAAVSIIGSAAVAAGIFLSPLLLLVMLWKIKKKR